LWEGKNMATKITRDVLESYIGCKTKAHLKLNGQEGTKSDYEGLLIESRGRVRLAAIDRILVRHPGGEVVRNVPLTVAALKEGSAFVLDAVLEDDQLSLHFDGLKRVDGASRLGGFHYVPMLFHEGRQVGKEQRLLLRLYGLLLSRLQGKAPAFGIVWHGKACKATKVRLSPDVREAERLLDEVEQLRGATPGLVLNDHCQACEFRQRCHARAVQEDNLSLLRGMGDKEIRKQHRKGIFTVTQLSCTFRPRRRGRRARAKAGGHPYQYPLKALAVREKKVYVFEPVASSPKPVSVYLDVEGDSEGPFVYLIGALVVANGTTRRLSYWADTEQDEPRIFRKLLAALKEYDDYTLFHYGSYELAYLKRMRKQGDGVRQIDKLIRASVNVLSWIRSSYYFPTYSNGLKDIGGYLGCVWPGEVTSGLQALVWRERWERSRDNACREILTAYNFADCDALRRVTEFLLALGGRQPAEPESGHAAPDPRVAWVKDLEGQMGHADRFRGFSSADYKYINNCAYFHYQRDRVLFRASEILKRVHGKKRPRSQRVRPNRRVEVRSVKCPHCKGRNIRRAKAIRHAKLEYDLRVTQGGIRRLVTQYRATTHWCRDCQRQFLPVSFKRRTKRRKYGHALASWVIYQHVGNCISFPKIWAMLKDCFGLRLPYAELHMLNAVLANYYRKTYAEILARIIAGHLLHADETGVRLRATNGYVWVFTSLIDVAYLYKPTREGDFLKELLQGFDGVLVTDFYSAYDSLDCKQQKCLIHLVRDMNDDLAHSPYDEDYKGLLGDFGRLLRLIVTAIDKHGLRKRHLQPLKGDVSLFFQNLAGRQYSSELAEKYQQRLLRCREKLFTFMDYDGVPWNNNNAEHAVKQFAYYRDIADGRIVESGLGHYLVLLSIAQTCKFRGINFLQFLLSGKRSVVEYSEGLQRGRQGSPDEVFPGGYPRLYGSEKTPKSQEGTQEP
jgi:predicted RecB family nuclease